MLDPRISLLHWATVLLGKEFRPNASVGAVRSAFAQLNLRFGMPAVSQVETATLVIPTSDGATIRAHLHRPSGACEPLPVLLFFHGGGCVIGDVECYDHLTRYFSHEGRVAVISVDYRLGPEHRFPTAFHDGFDAYAWVRREGRALGLDTQRIAIGGDSAGGSIAATISAYYRDRALEPAAFQFLIYPPLDWTERFRSRRQFDRGVPMTPELRTWFATHFLRTPADATHRYLRQIDAPDPQFLPPTYFLAAAHDALVDEGACYAQRVADAGVPIVYDLRPTLAHGFVNFPAILPEARRALRDGITAVATALREM
jgi:acetyl esterase